MFHPVALVLVRGVIVVYCLICMGMVFIVRLCGLTIVIVAFLPKKKKKNALSASLVVVTMGSLHMVSERVQPTTWEHYGFR
jgi:hypothetical protein